MEVAKHSSHNQRPQGKKTNLLTQRLERLMSDIKDQHPKTKALKDLIYKDRDPEDVVLGDKDVKDNPHIFLMSTILAFPLKAANLRFGQK